MESSNEEFFTKSKSEDDFLTLKYLAPKLVFYINNNTIMNIEKSWNSCFGCECHKFSGCAMKNGELGYCTLCQFNNFYFSYLSFTNKNIDYHIKLLIQLIEDLKKSKDLIIFDGDYTSKSMNFQEGTVYEWSLYKDVFESNYLADFLK